MKSLQQSFICHRCLTLLDEHRLWHSMSFQIRMICFKTRLYAFRFFDREYRATEWNQNGYFVLNSSENNEKLLNYSTTFIKIECQHQHRHQPTLVLLFGFDTCTNTKFTHLSHLLRERSNGVRMKMRKVSGSILCCVYCAFIGSILNLFPFNHTTSYFEALRNSHNFALHNRLSWTHEQHGLLCAYWAKT